MKITIFGGLLVAALTITSLAQAQTRTPAINKKQKIEARRINEGVRAGKLTARQAFRLRMDERKLREEKRMARADGRITSGERRHLRIEERKINRAINRDERRNRV